MEANDPIARSKKIGLTGIAPDMDFTGQTVLVTGGADGIGAGIVRALTQLGAYVISLDVQREKLRALEDELGRDKVAGIVFDLSQTDEAAHQMLGTRIGWASPAGRVDAYIMNAGVVRLTDIEKCNTVANTPMSEFYKLAQINAHSHAAIYQKIRHILTEDARIVVTGSPIIGRADPKTAAYSVTKRMLDSYANNIAAELKGTGIKISGYVSPPTQNYLRRVLKPKEPLHAHPEGIDIAELILRLASRTVKADFNGMMVAYGYDHLRDKTGRHPDGSAYDFMRRDPDDNGFVYDLRVRPFDQGGGDEGKPLVTGYSTAAMREILGLGRTPDMQTDVLLQDVYHKPSSAPQARGRPRLPLLAVSEEEFGKLTINLKTNDRSWVTLFRIAVLNGACGMEVIPAVMDVTERYPDEPEALLLVSHVIDRVAQYGYVEPVEAAMEATDYSPERKQEKARDVARHALRVSQSGKFSAVLMDKLNSLSPY